MQIRLHYKIRKEWWNVKFSLILEKENTNTMDMRNRFKWLRVSLIWDIFKDSKTSAKIYLTPVLHIIHFWRFIYLGNWLILYKKVSKWPYRRPIRDKQRFEIA